MTTQKLLGRLLDESYEYMICSDPDVTINGIKMLTHDQHDIKSDILYFGSSDLLPKYLAETQFLNFLGYGKSEIPSYYNRCKNCNFIMLKADTDPYLSYNLLQDYFIEEQEQTSKIRRMLSALLSNNGLQYLIDEASLTLGNPIFVIDTSYKYIARHIGNLPSDDSEYAKTMQQEMEFNSILESGIEHIKESRLDEIVGKMDSPYNHFNSYFGRSTMISSVRVHNIEVAHLMMVEQDHSFSQMDYECFLRLSHFVAQEMQKDAFYLKNEGQMFSYFLIDLLNDLQPTKHIIERRLKILHYRLLEKFYVVIIQPYQDGFTGQDIDLLSSQLQSILTKNIYAIYQNSFVILFNRKTEAPLGEYTEETLKRYASINNLKVGISNAFNDLTDINRFYHQAEKAAQLGERFPKAQNFKPLFYYRDYAYVEMLEICRAKTNLMNFCHPCLTALLNYDKESNSDLMGTLFEYLEHSANTQRTAKALFIHKNTLLYRLDRIKTILNNDLSSGEDLFMFHLSFRVLIYLGVFIPKPVVTEIMPEEK